MHYRSIFRFLGKILIVMSFFLLLPLIVGMCYGEWTHIWPFLVTIAIFLVVGFAAYLPTSRSDGQLRNKEALVIVGLSWLVISLIGTLPFVLDGCIPNYIDALFETVSGFTTTGASILDDIPALPKCMLFWRSFTHWIGGMGILVFILAIMPGTDGTTYHLFKFESPGPQVGKIASKVRHTATILYVIYFVMTLVEVVLLLFGGIGLFDSVLIAMSTAGTGGFAATGLSIAEYQSLYVEIVVMVFMFLFSINFSLYYLLLLGHVKEVFCDEEFHFFIGYVAAAILAITFSLLNTYQSFAEALRYGAFAVLSLTSSTGFSTADFTTWSEFAKSVLLLCMVVGASAGSTGGGLKASRMLILLKAAKAHVLRVLRPQSLQIVKMNGKVLSQDEVASVLHYFLIWAGTLVLATLLLSLNGFDFLTNFSSVITCLNNDGPGMTTMVGPFGGFGMFDPYSKIILIFLMIVGRLEIYPFLLLLLPKTWSKKF